MSRSAGLQPLTRLWKLTDDAAAVAVVGRQVGRRKAWGVRGLRGWGEPVELQRAGAGGATTLWSLNPRCAAVFSVSPQVLLRHPSVTVAQSVLLSLRFQYCQPSGAFTYVSVVV